MHVPVLTKEILSQLNLQSGENVIDATLDGGGHTRLFMEAIKPDGKVLGIEQDAKIIQSLKSEKMDRLIIANGNFRDIAAIAKKHNFSTDAIFFDLGMSTWHLKKSGRGFSFQNLDEILDMRFSEDAITTATEILNSFSKENLSQIFKEYGEEKRAHFFAKKVVEFRKNKKIIIVSDFINALSTKHPKVLARIFQALRIFINDEISVLRNGLTGAFEILRSDGRIAVLSYHSLEDREVKNFFKEIQKNQKGKTLKKPITSSFEETKINPSARSAKLRILWKT